VTGWARSSAVGWGTVLQAGRSQVQFPMVSLEFFTDITLPAILWPWGWLSLKQKCVPWILPGGQRHPVHRADLTTFMCWLPWNLGASTSWNPQGLSRPVMGLLYLLMMWQVATRAWLQGQPLAYRQLAESHVNTTTGYNSASKNSVVQLQVSKQFS
jgi:hypothetical protein